MKSTERKFNSGPVGYYSRLERNSNTFTTENEISSSFAKEVNESFKEILNSPKKLSTTLKAVKIANESTQTTVAIRVPTSSTSAAFDPKKIRKLLSECTGEDFKDLFYQATSKNDSEKIRLTDIDTIVTEKLGNDVPSWVLAKFLKLGEESSIYGELNWVQFRDIADRVLAASNAECSLTKVKPTWLNKSNSDTASFETPVITSYQDDYRSFEEDGRDVLSQSTTRHLFTGTSKMTKRLPGYGGHIPENMKNPIKQSHASGEIIREPHYDLRLTRPKAGYMPGYSGFVPVNAIKRTDEE